MQPKKTVVISVKISPEKRDRAGEIIARTGPGTVSRYVRAVVDDLIAKADAGERIAEPPQLLTEKQRRKLERE